jgi:CHAT domain-containing protein/Tfp pilus assembly protein PilF
MIRKRKKMAKRILLLLNILTCIGINLCLSSTERGVVVEDVAKGSAAEKAGLQPGDIITAWEVGSRPSANPEKDKGAIGSVFDFWWVEWEQGPRGSIKLLGERSGQSLNFVVPAEDWRVKVEPKLDGEILSEFRSGIQLIKAGEVEKGKSLLAKAVQSAKKSNDHGLVTWLTLQTGTALADVAQGEGALAVYQEALRVAQLTDSAVAQASIWEALATLYRKQNKFDEAEKALNFAIETLGKKFGDGLSVARFQNGLATLARSRGNLKTAGAAAQAALDICEKFAPASLLAASVLNNLGTVSRRLGDLEKAESTLKRSRAILENLAPGSAVLAGTLNNLGNVARNRGDLDAAEDYLKKTLAIDQKDSPESPDAAVTFINLGNVAFSRDNLETAENYYQRALAIKKKLTPDSEDIIHIYNNLAVIAGNRYDYDSAESYLKMALSFWEKVKPDGPDMATNLQNLGVVFMNRRGFESAETYFRRALAIWENLAPGGLNSADVLDNLGHLAMDKQDLKAAEEFFRQGLLITDKNAPGSLAAAGGLGNLGEVAAKKGNLQEAEVLYAKAATIEERLAPGSSRLSSVLHSLGAICLKTNRLQEASNYFRRSIDAIETHIGKLGGSQDIKAAYRAEHKSLYQSYIDVLMKLNKPEEAFQTLERWRARQFLAMLAERDLVFLADVPEELERGRKRTAWDYDRIQGRLAELNPEKDKAEIEKLLGDLRILRSRQTEIAEQIKKVSPNFAALQYPEALDLLSTQKALDPGTAVLSYDVGEERSRLFVVTPKRFAVLNLAVPEKILRSNVEKFNLLIQRGQAGSIQEGLLEQGRMLYKTLIQPAGKIIEKSERILLIPDGPLQTLSFGALIRPTKTNGINKNWQFLVEWKPIHVVLSATVFDELRKQRKARDARRTGITLLAFGDPKYSVLENQKVGDVLDTIVRTAVTRGYDLTPLPGTRKEATSIADLYKGEATIYLGEDATEERAKAISKDIRYIHFACHGFLDELFPLNSGLALSIPRNVREGQENGILQAWEVFERVRIDADLVTLSACETGLGKEIGGEGLIGLTRAFHYAGARTVLASLWRVADVTTAELMRRFYSYLKAGLSKDKALQLAQIELIRHPVQSVDENGQTIGLHASHPYFWAAFQLTGDWK